METTKGHYIFGTVKVGGAWADHYPQGGSTGL